MFRHVMLLYVNYLCENVPIWNIEYSVYTVDCMWLEIYIGATLTKSCGSTVQSKEMWGSARLEIQANSYERWQLIKGNISAERQ